MIQTRGVTILPASEKPADLLADSSHGLVVVGHGTLDVHGKAEFFELVTLIARQLPGWVVEPAFLEMASPDFTIAVQRAIERGATTVDVLPLLLFAAGHARNDLPRLLETAAITHPGVHFRLKPVLNCQTDLVALSALRFRDAVGAAADFDPAKTMLLLVGRGSSDPEACREMLHFADLRRQRTPLGHVDVCFLAICEPLLESALPAAASSEFRRIVVQPHLLFRGELSERVASAVGRAAAQYPQKSWISADPLGPHPLLAAAALEAAGLGATRN